jgi:hypothetical protein
MTAVDRAKKATIARARLIAMDKNLTLPASAASRNNRWGATNGRATVEVVIRFFMVQ